MELATVEALQGLVLGRTIEIRFAGERRDRYGRLKGHAFLAARRWHHLGAEPSARAGPGTPPMCLPCIVRARPSCSPRSKRRARPARVSGLRLPTQCGPADAPATLLRHAATFQVVEGRVTDVATTRGSIYLNFGEGRRRGFSASLRLGDRARLGRFSDNPKGLEQALVRVRGWIVDRAGQPAIDLTAAGSVEVIAEADVSDPTGGRRAERRPRPK
jgi:hypothetical protein